MPCLGFSSVFCQSRNSSEPGLRRGQSSPRSPTSRRRTRGSGRHSAATIADEDAAAANGGDDGPLPGTRHTDSIMPQIINPSEQRAASCRCRTRTRRPSPRAAPASVSDRRRRRPRGRGRRQSRDSSSSGGETSQTTNERLGAALQANLLARFNSIASQPRLASASAAVALPWKAKMSKASEADQGPTLLPSPCLHRPLLPEDRTEKTPNRRQKSRTKR